MPADREKEFKTYIPAHVIYALALLGNYSRDQLVVIAPLYAQKYCYVT